MLLKLNAFNVTGTSGWDNFDLTATGTRIANIINRDTGLNSNIRMEHTGAVWTKAANGALTNQTWYGVEENVWDNTNFIAIASASTTTLIGTGLVAGQQYLITFAGAVTQARNTTITANGVSATYICTAQATPITPTQPVTLVCTAVDAGGGEAKIDFTFSGNSVNKTITFITVSDAVASINSVNSNNTVKVNQTATWSVSGFTPTSATLNGIALSSVSGSGFTVFNYGDNVSGVPYSLLTLSATDGVQTDTISVRVYPDDEYGYTRIDSVANNTEGYLKYYLPNLVVGDYITYLLPSQLSVAVNGVDYDGRILTDYDGTQTMYWFDSSENKWFALTVTTSTEVVVSVSLELIPLAIGIGIGI